MRAYTQRVRAQAALSVAVLALLPAAASAQIAANQPAGEQVDPQTESVEQQGAGGVANVSSEATNASDIVVTGTLLRGTAPVGSNVISLGRDRIQAQGATTTNELLATVPQVSNFFNNVPTTVLAGAVNANQSARPNLRNLSNGSSASSSTLVLVDGHRVASTGVTQSTVDPDLIPSGAIERVEVVTDGGSSTYGADAVGGVINFITRRRFDGVRVDARYGFADDYWTTDANAVVGKDWGSGSLWGSYSFTKNNPLLGRDRGFIRGLNYGTSPATPRSLQCDPANVTVGGQTYGYPGSTPTPSYCDPTDTDTFLPASERHGAVVGLFQQLNHNIDLNVRAYYSQRRTEARNAFRARVSVPSTNPYYFVPPGVAPADSEIVDFDFSPVLGDDALRTTTFAQQWGVNAEVRADLGGGFEIRTLLNYGRSNTNYSFADVNPTLLTAAANGTTSATAINPFDIAATANQQLIRDIVNYGNEGQAKDDLVNARVIIDGSLFSLPGGDFKVAAGYELLVDSFQQRFTSGAPLGTLTATPFTNYDRTVHAFFGEAQLPIFGEGNRTGGLYSLLISGSARYDHYSDFGGTFNPKAGVTYKPVQWFALRGTYGTSFNAPSPVDQLGSLRNTVLALPFAAFIRPGDNINFFGNGLIALQGAIPDLKPQTATTWSVGADLDLPFLEGLHASVNYFDVKFEDILATPTPNTGIFRDFPNNVQTSVTGIDPAAVRAFASQSAGGLAAANALLSLGIPIYELIDFRTGNYGQLKVRGLDYTVNYNKPTGFGSVDASVSGTYQLSRRFAASRAAAYGDQLAFDNPRLTMQTTLGTTLGHLRAQATWNHTSGFNVQPLVADVAPQQTKVGDFDTVNLFFKYDVPENSGILKGLSFTVNVNNVLDEDPPALRQTNANGYTNGFTIGRLIMLGLSKKF